MPIISTNYEVATGEHGLAVLTVSGRCTHDMAAAVTANCCRRYQLVTVPNVVGALLKSMDGTAPVVVAVTPATSPQQTFRCVKVDGVCTPLAPVQTAGPYIGKAILRYVIRYQQVGATA